MTNSETKAHSGPRKDADLFSSTKREQNKNDYNDDNKITGERYINKKEVYHVDEKSVGNEVF